MIRATRWAACLYILLSPAITLSTPLLLLGSKKVVLADLAFLALLVVAVVSRPTVLRWPPLRILLASLLVVVCVGLATVPPYADKKEWMRVAYSMIVLNLFASLNLDDSEWIWLRRSWLAAFSLVVIVGLVALALALSSDAPWLEKKNSTSLGIPRLAGLMTTNAVVLWMTVSTPFLLVSGALSTPLDRKLLRTALALFVVALILAPSRGTVCLVLALSLMASRMESGPLIRWRQALSGASIVLLVAWFAVTLTGRLPRFPNTMPDAKGWLNPRLDSHFLLHRAGLALFVQRPILGVGPGRFGDSLPKVLTTEERSLAWPPLDAQDWDPHSFWLGWLAEGGAVVLLSFVALHLVILESLLLGKAFAVAMACALVGVSFMGVHLDYGSVKFFWAAMGIALGMRRAKPRLGSLEG